MRYAGLENDYSYLEYNKMRERIVNVLNNDDSEIDISSLTIMLHIIKGKRVVLDKIKEYYDGENRNINSEIREGNYTCNC